MTLTEREEYLEGGYAELSCAHCEAVVRVRKSSPQQTSVQWTTGATRRCDAFHRQKGCRNLRASIDDAVRAGKLEVI